MARNSNRHDKHPNIKDGDRQTPITTQAPVTPRHEDSAPPIPNDGTKSRTADSALMTLQQRRARYALSQVKGAVDRITADAQQEHRSPDRTLNEFKSYAASFPAMIQMNGLGQAAAFYFSQQGTYRLLYEILSGWLVGEAQPYSGEASLLAGITGRDMHAYRIAQAESLLLLDWIKRFAKAFVREGD